MNKIIIDEMRNKFMGYDFCKVVIPIRIIAVDCRCPSSMFSINGRVIV